MKKEGGSRWNLEAGRGDLKGMHFETKKRYSFYILLIMCIVVDICDRERALLERALLERAHLEPSIQQPSLI